MDDSVELAIAFPLDSERFLRRECPTCERQFKWHSSAEEGQSEQVPEGGYFCPYCAVHAPADSWFTKAQLTLIENTVQRDVVRPALEELSRGLRDIGRRSGGFLRIDVESTTSEPLEPLTELDDMRRVDFSCHPLEPVKVLDAWTGPVHCLVCGTAVEG